MRLTQDQLGRRLGLSQRTVAFALSDAPDAIKQLRPSTRARVREAAQRLGYRPHRQAQIMRGVKSGTIGVINVGGLNLIGAHRAMRIAEVVEQAGYQMLASEVHWWRKGVAASCAAMLDAHVEGVLLLVPPEWFPLSELGRLEKARIPVVAVEGVRFPGIPQVCSDVQQGFFDLTTHLLALGHRRLTLLTVWPSQTRDEDHCWPMLECVRGFRRALEKAGGLFVAQGKSHGADPARLMGDVVDETITDYWSNPHECGRKAMETVLKRPLRPHAVLCSNDDWALGALTACADAGVKVPDEIAVVGSDNTQVSGYGMVPLTTVALPLEQIAKRAMEMLLTLMRGEPIPRDEQRVKLPGQLVVRRSCGARGLPRKT